MTDAEIIARVRGGDRRAYGLLVDRYRRAVYAQALHLLGRAEDASDVAQETFLQAYLRLNQLRDETRFAPWLRRIVLNECRMWQRRSRWTSVPLEEAAPAQGDMAAGVCARLVLAQALDRLSAETRLTFTLYYTRAYSLKEVAAFLAVPETTVKSRLRDARARLRKELMEMATEDYRKEPLPGDFTAQVLKMTSRALKPIDRQALLAFLERDRLTNLCLLSEIEKPNAWEQDDPEGALEFWGVEAEGEMVGAMMRIGHNWIPAQSHSASAALLAAYIDGHAGRQLLYGPAEITTAIASRLEQHHIAQESAESLEVVERLAVDPATLPVARRAQPADADSLVALYDNPEMHRSASSVRAHIGCYGDMGLRVWFCPDEDGGALSACLTRYESRDAAYVDFVYTRPERRGQGYATACLAGMCAELLSEGKRPCFTCSDTDKADLYRKVGAKPYATWRYYETEPTTAGASHNR